MAEAKKMAKEAKFLFASFASIGSFAFIGSFASPYSNWVGGQFNRAAG